MSHQPLADETIPDSGKLFIITGRPGRLGNRLFLFAHFIAFAEEHRHRIRNFTFQTYAKFFEGTCRDIFCEYPVASHRNFLNSVPGAPDVIAGTRMLYRGACLLRTLNEKFHLLGRSVITLGELPGQRSTLLESPEVQSRIRSAKTIFVDGWKIRAPDCVPKHAEKIRRYFQSVPSIEQNVQLLIERMRQNAQVIIGVHIRHTDYRRWRGGRYFFPASRYAGWMRELAGQFPGAKVSFVVCSDEPRNLQEFSGLSVVLSENSPFGDLCTLSKCDYILGPLSTFTRWASFQGNKPLFHLRDSNDRVDRDQFRVSWLEDD